MTERSVGSERDAAGEFAFPGKYCCLIAKGSCLSLDISPGLALCACPS